MEFEALGASRKSLNKDESDSERLQKPLTKLAPENFNLENSGEYLVSSGRR